jgi:RND family efflux transporter MFP subunit
MTPTIRLRPCATSRCVIRTFCLSLSLLCGAAGAQTPNANAPKPALTVSMGSPSVQTLPVQIKANGNIAAWQEASVGSEIGGLRLTEVRVNVGDVVKAGQVLAVFHAAPVQADLAQAQANLSQAQAAANEARANAERARGLQPTGVISAQQFVQYITAEETAVARVAAAKASVDSQQLRMQQTQVLAPDSGIIAARSASVGAVLAPGTELFRLIRQGRLEWRAEVIASELATIKPGMAVNLVAASGAQLTGRVRMIGPTVDPQTRQALVYVDLQTPSAGKAPALAGMYASGSIQSSSSRAVTVPAQAVVSRDGFNYVMQLKADNRVGLLKVQTGRRLGDHIEITQGLPEGVKLVTQGAGFLNEGDAVRVAP